MKNSRQIRLKTLLILKRFEQLGFIEPSDPEIEISENYQNKKCNCIDLMYDFEKTEIGFTYEKSKEMQLRNLEVLIKSRAMPNEYLMLAYHFLIGCLWIKFSPIFPAMHDCISAIIINTGLDLQQHLVSKHVSLI